MNLELLIKTNKGVKLTLDGEKLYKKLDDMFGEKVLKLEINDGEISGTIKM